MKKIFLFDNDGVFSPHEPFYYKANLIALKSFYVNLTFEEYNENWWQMVQLFGKSTLIKVLTLSDIERA